MTTTTRRIAACAIGLALAATAACGTAPKDAAAAHQLAPKRLTANGSYFLPTNSLARAALGAQAARLANADGLFYDEHLVQVLPNEFLSVNGGASVPITKGLVIGNVTNVEPGQAFTAEEDGARGTSTPFDSANAMWRIAVVTINAEHYLKRDSGHVVDEPGSVRVGVVIIGDDYQLQMQGLQALGKVAVVLDPDRTYDFEPGLPAVARNGALFGDVDGAGHVGFPALDEASADYVGALDTVPEIVAAATQDDVHRVINVVDGLITQILPSLPLNPLNP
jgi:hypothetical protein